MTTGNVRELALLIPLMVYALAGIQTQTGCSLNTHHLPVFPMTRFATLGGPFHCMTDLCTHV